MTKQELRKEYLVRRSQLSNRSAMDSAIYHHLLSQPFYKDAKTIMTYISYKSEPDTHALIQTMLKDGKTLCAPLCETGGQMESYVFCDFSELVLSKLGILEPQKQQKKFPEELDLILVPGCCFTKNGYRLGYGGGYYDRYLPRTHAVTCGLFYDCLQGDFVPEESDLPLHYIITEKHIHCFL